MSDPPTADPVDCRDLHTIYAAYQQLFSAEGIPWYEKSWGQLFESFDAFLGFFNWPAFTVTDEDTGRAHVVTNRLAWVAFANIVATRFGERLPPLPASVAPRAITPFETRNQLLYLISSEVEYRKVFSTLPAVQLKAQMERARKGEPGVVRDLWATRNKTFLAIDFEWSETDPSKVLEWGYAVVQCGSDGLSHEPDEQWPPRPEKYRRGHYIVREYLNIIHNKYQPNYPRDYAFGKSQIISKDQLSRVIQATISCFASADSETASNELVLVGHGINGDLVRLREMGIILPSNAIIVDTAAFERQLFASGQRHPYSIQTASGTSRQHRNAISLLDTLRSLGVAFDCKLHNAGNDAMMCLLALQLLLEPKTELPQHCWVQGREPPPVHSSQNARPTEPVYCMYGLYVVN